ncbi:MAG: hypothetical protein CMA63_04375 [Euryarchaeota archaeon]|nr:hypothetical protein [Euryarchaeota archaeon]|tara:strand:+ start:25213 stop:25800 length:588 start_codon:yes stop_codon:yes gene_type:complete
MARSLKSAKSGLKEARFLAESLQELVQTDIKRQLSGFNESLFSRINEAEGAILDATKGKLAIVAGIGVMRKDIERAHRRFTRSNNVEELRTALQEIAGRLLRLRKANDNLIQSLHAIIHPTLTAVEVVEKFASDLQRSAGAWERNGRDIDEAVLELCDFNEPAEIGEFEQYIVKQGYSALFDEATLHSSSEEEDA